MKSPSTALVWFRRDLRDDRRDLVRVTRIRSEFWNLRGRMDRRALDRKHGLQFAQAMFGVPDEYAPATADLRVAYDERTVSGGGTADRPGVARKRAETDDAGALSPTERLVNV